MMNCKNHELAEAKYYCSCCGQPLCLDCTVEINNKHYCKVCLEKSIEINKSGFQTKNRAKKSKFLAFILSAIPGAGHMYLGLLNKGLSIMVLFFGLIFFMEAVDNIIFFNAFSGEALMVAISIIFISYSVFDSLAKAEDINSGIIIYDSEGFDFSKIYNFIIVNIKGRKNIIGYVLVILGCFSILSIFSNSIDQILSRYFNFSFPFTMTDLFISAILVGLGVYFIKKGRDESM